MADYDKRRNHHKRYAFIPIGKKEGRKTYSESTYGFYNIAFHSQINRATDKDVSLKKIYGIQLVTKYHEMAEGLLRLVKARSKGTLNTSTEVYYVKLGKIVYGKLSITIESRNKERIISYIYQYKSTAIGYKKEHNIKNEKLKARTNTFINQNRRNYKNTVNVNKKQNDQYKTL